MAIEGMKLRVMRKTAGIGQAELARRIGVSQGMISQLEHSCRSCRTETLEAIAKELKCLPEDLTGQPQLWIQFMRNCKNLTLEQLEILNSLVAHIVKITAQSEG
jgi:transcriptional regulator with XRE-family HTH domain